MASIKLLFDINAPQEKVFEALTAFSGLSNWWTTNVTGDIKTGGVLQFRFGDFGGPDMEVREIKRNESVVWECVGGPEGWIGHIFSFHLDTNDNKTRVRFEQSGWKETGDFYASCCFSWGRYMESLRQYCQTGKGEAFGSEGYRK